MFNTCTLAFSFHYLFFVTTTKKKELVNRTRDVSEEVRKAAFATLSKKVDVFKYTPDQMASLIDVLLTKKYYKKLVVIVCKIY